MDTSRSYKLCVYATLAVMCGCCIVALSVPKWYHIRSPGIVDASFGVFRSCTQSGSSGATVCSVTSFADITAGCSRSGAEMRRRVASLGGTATTIPPLLVLATVAFALGGSRIVGRWVAVALTTVSTLLAAFDVAYTAYIFHAWYYCGTDYCSYIAGLGMSTAGCSASGSSSWYFMIATIGMGLVATTVQAAALIVTLQNRMRETQKARPPTADEELFASPAASNMPFASPLPVQTVSCAAPFPSPEPATTGRPPAPRKWPDFSGREMNPNNILPDGEWIYDPQSRLYWSNEEQLYVHLESGLFFDPVASMWYDSNKEEWIDP